MKKRAIGPGVFLVLAGAALLVLAALSFAQALSPAEQVQVLAQRTASVPLVSLAASPTPLIVLTPRPTPSAMATDASPEGSAPALSTDQPTLAPIPTLAPAPAVAPTGQLSRPVRIVIARINVNAPVVEMGWTIVQEGGQPVSEWNVPKNDVGHALNSANPGERGNVVLSGHNNLFAAVFRKLYTLQVGDEIVIYNAQGQGYLYRVNQSYIVPEAGVPPEQRLANAAVLLPTADARVTLTSCWPETSNTHRAIVIAGLSGLVQP